MQKTLKNKRLVLIVGIVVMIGSAVLLAVAAGHMRIRLKPPQNVRTEAGLHTVQVSWDTVEGAASYEVSVYEPTEHALLLTEQTEETRLELTGLNADHKYEISVAARGEVKGRKIESEASERVSVRTAVPAPEQVEGLKAERRDSGTVMVCWMPYETMDTNADGSAVEISYTILFADAEGGTYEILAENLEKAEYLHEGLEELTTCYYKIRVQEQMDGKTYYSRENSEPAVAEATIGAVGGLAAESVSESVIRITWEPYSLEKTNADGTLVGFWYTLYAAEEETAEYVILADKLTETAYQEENLTPSTTRYYKVSVTAQKDGNDITGVLAGPVSATTPAAKKVSGDSGSKTPSGSGTGAGSGASSGASTEKEQKEAQARVIAQQIADSITGDSDLEKVRQAAAIVAEYCRKAVYTNSDPDYKTAYGVFCKGVYTCAGSTRALGMVLECMGYRWEHINEHQWTHQWCQLIMDGQIGWADGMAGIADYGACPFASGGTYTAPDGTIYFVP